MALGPAGVPGRGLAGLIGVVALGFDCGSDLSRALGEQLARPFGYTRDTPVPEPTRRSVVGRDGVAELDGFGRRSHPAERGGGVKMSLQCGGVQGFPAGFAVGHVAQVCDQNVIVGFGITGPGGGVTGARPDQTMGGTPGLGPASASAPGHEPGVEIREVASVSASKMACMSSARPTRPSSATGLWAATTSSIPGRFAFTRRVRRRGFGPHRIRRWRRIPLR